jgi:hypothetical protein
MKPYSTMGVPSDGHDSDRVFVAVKGPMIRRYFDPRTLNSRCTDNPVSFSFGFPLPCLSISRADMVDPNIHPGWKEYMESLEGDNKNVDGGYVFREEAVAAGYQDATLAD